MKIISEILILVKRSLIRYTRVPQLLVFSTIQPVMFVILFAYVFGGAIKTSINYVDYLLPGILVQTTLFGAMMTGIGLADDISHGMIDRFRSLPMSRGAVLAGRTISDLLRNVFVIFLMVGGFWYLSSAGNEEQAEKGQKTITNSIIGLVVIIMAYAIVRIVAGLLG